MAKKKTTKSSTIEAEKGELVLRNEAGDYAIIPRRYRREVQDMLKDGCHKCLDSFIATLPTLKNI